MQTQTLVNAQQVPVRVDGAAARAPRGASTRSRHRRAVERVIETMQQRLSEPFHLDEMARVALMSRFHFSQAFRRLTGLPPCTYLGTVRLEAAKRLLLTTRLSITEVCLEVGYSSLSTFVRRFGSAVGVSPRRLRSLAASPESWPGPVRSTPAANSPTRAVVSGRIASSETVPGPIFVGLFETSIPQGWPVACDILEAPGDYSLAVSSEGVFYLYAAATAGSATAYLLPAGALRGGGSAVTVSGGRVCGATNVDLRAPEPTDLPILVALPVSAAAPEDPVATEPGRVQSRAAQVSQTGTRRVEREALG